MTPRYIGGASIGLVLTWGLVVVAPANAQNSTLLPAEESAVITVTGCLQRGGKDGEEYLLASPRLGPVASVTDAACDAAIDSRALDLDDTKDRGINETLVGRWIEISGRLERETSDNPENLRELSVRSFRLIPVVPQRAEATPAPVAAPAAESPAPAPILPAPVATSGIQEPLPKTASPLAVIGLLGLLSVAGSFGFRVYRSRVHG
jgi:hypothetical protein